MLITIVGIVITAATAIISVLTDTRRSGIIRGILCFFAICGAIVGILGAFSTQAKQRELREEIAHLKVENRNFITGGDSFPIIIPATEFDSDEGHMLSFKVRNHGNYPLYDLSVQMMDWTAFKKLGAAISEIPHQIGYLGSKQEKPIQTKIHIRPEDKDRHLTFKTTALNGTTNHTIKMVRGKGRFGWPSALRVQDEAGKIIYESVHKDFSKNEKREVDWN